MMWWDASQRRRPGAREPYGYDLSPDLEFALEEVKEQMLIRRDVKKDESPPEEQEFHSIEVGLPIAALDTPPLRELVPPKERIARAQPLESPLLDRTAREAELQRPRLVNDLAVTRST